MPLQLTTITFLYLPPPPPPPPPPPLLFFPHLVTQESARETLKNVPL